MSEQFKAAFSRAAFGGLFIGLLMFLTQLQVPNRTRLTVEDAAIAGAVAFVGYIVARGGFEGWIDTARQLSGNVLPSDVGQGQK